MKTYEQERMKFLSKNSDYVEEYDYISGKSLMNDLDSLWRTYSTTGVSPNKFFGGVRRILVNSYGNYENIDIINILSNDISNNKEMSISLQNYFNDIKTAYNKLSKKHPEYATENRDDIINSNLKLVISIAKKYRNRGLSFEELISAGNLGLVTAWEKYDPEKNKLRDVLINILENSPSEVSKDYIRSIFEDEVVYGNDLIDDIKQVFSEERAYKKEEVVDWVNKHIKNAKFSSVAALWIRAYILQEINNCSRVVRKPKSDIDKDFEETGRYLRENIIPIEINDEDGVYNVDLPDTTPEHVAMDDPINRSFFKAKIEQLLDGVNLRDRRILFRSFGIGLPRSMSIKEISDIENVTQMRVTQIVQASISTMRKNAVKLGISEDDIFKYINDDQ